MAEQEPNSSTLIASESVELDSVRAAIAGDDGAFDVLVVRYADRLRSMIRHRLDPALRGRLSADDVMQETLLVASERVRSIVVSNDGDFWAWLCSIAEHRIIDARRRHLLTAKRDARRASSLVGDLAGGPGVGMGEGHQDVLAQICPPSEDARAAERSIAIDRAIAELPPSYRDVIRLRIVQGMSTTDAALAMNRTPGALSVLLCKAVRRLGETLREERQDHR